MWFWYCCSFNYWENYLYLFRYECSSLRELLSHFFKISGICNYCNFPAFLFGYPFMARNSKLWLMQHFFTKISERDLSSLRSIMEKSANAYNFLWQNHYSIWKWWILGKIWSQVAYITTTTIFEKPRGNKRNYTSFLKSGEIDKMLGEWEEVDKSKSLPVRLGEFSGLIL